MHDTEQVAEAAKAAAVKRVVLVSSQLVHPQNKWSFIRLILNNIITGLSGTVCVPACARARACQCALRQRE